MPRDVIIRINAQDAASPVFKKLAAEAQATGATVETTNARTSRSYDDLQKKATAVGAGIGALIGVSALAGRSFVTQEQQILGLNRAYGESSVAMQKLAEDLQRTTVFSNDMARQSEMTASTLIRNYGFTAAEVEKVIRVSADLASVTGFDLADATMRVTAALRGEAESAEALGLTMNQQAIDRENLTLTMSNEEAAHYRLNALLDQSAFAEGAAAEKANTHAGEAKQLVNRLQDLEQSFGGVLGPMGEYLSVLGSLSLALPLVTGAIGKMGAALAASGVGLGALGPLALAVGGASLAYGYSQDSFGTTQTNKFWNEFFLKGSQVMNALLPGNPYNEAKYTELMSQNRKADAIAALLLPPGYDSSTIWDSIAKLTGSITGEMNKEDLIKFIEQRAGASGLTIPQYIQTQAQANPEFVYDPVSGGYFPRAIMADIVYQRSLNLTGGIGYTATPSPNALATAVSPVQAGYSRYYGDISTTGYIGPYQPAAEGGAATVRRTYVGDPGYRTGGYPFAGTGAESATGGGMDVGAGLAVSVTSAIKAESEAYYGLATASEVASRGLSQFKATQDSILAKESVYGQQISEFSSQINAMEAGYEILNKRREDGESLSEAELNFLDNYDKAYTRLTGGVEDATVAQALLAEQYAINMEKGDQLNRTLEDTSGSVGDLVDIIEELILSLDNVPPEVKARIELERAEEARASLDTIVDLLNSIDGRTATFYVNVEGTGVSVGNPNGPGISPDLYALGGTVGAYANGGTVYDPLLPRFANGGTWAMVGERGPEIVYLSRGDQVFNAAATKSMAPSRPGRGRGGGNNIFTGIVNMYQVQDAFEATRGLAIGDAR